MSEPRLKRRKFLADALFAGGALGAAALATRFMLPKPKPEVPSVTAGLPPVPPKPCRNDEPVVDGEMEPVIMGRVSSPQHQEKTQ